MKDALLQGKLKGIASILGNSWEAKRNMARGISTSILESAMSVALDAGALSGKVSGAGGGGFMMLMVDPDNRVRLESALSRLPGRLMPFRFSPEGVESWSVEQ